jgi:uncharacterized protein YndB with AHSA1/START domain
MVVDEGNLHVTDQKSLKRRVRTRMSRTGERYTAARRQVLAKADVRPAEPTRPPADVGVDDEMLVARTGRPWAEWIAILDAWGARDRSHTDIARWVSGEHGVDGWWAQHVTVGYEKATGRRVTGQRSDGFEAGASKTIGVPVERLFAAFVDDEERARWLPAGSLRVRTATRARSARFDWQDGSSRLVAGFEAKGDQRSVVSLAHQRLANLAASAEMKAFWRERLAALKQLLEG